MDDETRELKKKLEVQKRMREEIIKKKEMKRRLEAVRRRKELEKKLAQKGNFQDSLRGVNILHCRPVEILGENRSPEPSVVDQWRLRVRECPKHWHRMSRTWLKSW